MILILTPNIDAGSAEYRQLMDHLTNLPNVQTRLHRETGTQQTLTEIYLVGDTTQLSLEDMRSLPGVDRVVLDSH
ncbi:MAG: hypothetical protein ACE5ET_06420 [Gammaproteobacteria bacterium]